MRRVANLETLGAITLSIEDKMAENVSVEVKAEPAIEHQILCFVCGRLTVHKVLAGAYESGSEDELPIDWWGQYEVVQCQGCRRISFREDKQNTEDVDFRGHDGPELVHHEKLWPPRVTGREELANLHYVPWQVQQVYRETHNAIASGMNILAGIGVRALVESVCKEKQAPGSNLNAKIDGLVEMGVLTEAGAEILHGTRLLGNRAAHEQEPIPMEVLNAAMEVAEHLLETVYILPAIAGDLPRRSVPPTAGDGA